MRFEIVLAAGLAASVASAAPAKDASPFAGVQGLRLDNGLRVLFYEDHSAPKVAVVTWVHVGSRDEDAGRTGFAHLFEHLMFKGTKGIADGRLDAILEEGGGFSSAFTTPDMTVYWEDAASSYLETILWLEQDRLGTLVDDFAQAKLANQQDVVRNERRQGIDNTPYARAYEIIQGKLWPEGHGYHWLTIGSHEDLVAATVDDVVAFFRRNYVPANMTTVIAGDFDPVEARRLVLQYLGKLPKQPAPERKRFAAPPAIAGPVLERMGDDVAVPRVHMAWRGPAIDADDEAAAILAGRVLGFGKSSRLYERLVYRDRIAQDASASFDDGEMGGSYNVIATAKPGVAPAKLRAAILDEIARLAATPPSAEELTRAQNVYEAGFLGGLESLVGRAIRIARYDVRRGKPDALAEDRDRFRKVTPEELSRAAKRWLDPAQRIDVTIVPEKK